MCSHSGVTEPAAAPGPTPPGQTSPGQTRTVENRLEFPYTRTVGPVIGGFLAGLREQRLLGARSRTGRVLVPPLEYDPDTGDPVDPDLVEVGPQGTVTTWTWVAEPKPKHPLDRPFAVALIRPDGADTALVHAVDAGTPEAMHTGMVVTPRWRGEPTGLVTDIEAWEPRR
ncbi:MAG: OB-fold domain-containing protein [Actinobacteria bacterium]|nr:OB-fold domain-containing protein [Actinomycetota bacterium]